MDVGSAEQVGFGGENIHLAPQPSWELSLDVLAKARAATLLKRRKSHEAGFTEQRSPPSSVDGGITGRFSTGPITPVQPLTI